MTTYYAALHSLAGFLNPWQSLFSNSKVVSDGVTFLHLAGLLFAGGFAVASDRAALRAQSATESERVVVLSDIARVHGPVLRGLAVIFVSGVLMAASDVETFGKSPVFLIKMILVALLGANGLVLQRTETALRALAPTDRATTARQALWSRLRMTAIASLSLWTAIVLAGTVLVNS